MVNKQWQQTTGKGKPQIRNFNTGYKAFQTIDHSPPAKKIPCKK